jgi:hypothetical protein
LAADGGYSTISADDGATVVSDVAHVVGPLAGSEGVSRAAGGRGVAPEGVCSFVWAVDGGFSTDCADGAATVVSDVAHVVWLLGGSSGGWDASRGAVDKLGGSGASGGGAVKSSEVDVAGEVVVVAVDVADDGCDAAIDACDAGCDDTTGGEVSVEETVGLGSEMHWSEVGVGILGVVTFFGHFFSNTSESFSHVSLSPLGKAFHQRCASE